VRQNFIQYLISVKNYPASLIAVEKEIRLGELKSVLIFWFMINNTSLG
jgi:hypothetical protein